MQRIGFSGHRDSITAEGELDRLRVEFPGATWVHGGATAGFDKQVAEYAGKWGIPTQVYLPDYETYGRRLAPLKRDEQVIDDSEGLVLCYDGREDPMSGTYQTLLYARRTHKRIRRVSCMKRPQKARTKTTTPEKIQQLASMEIGNDFRG